MAPAFQHILFKIHNKTTSLLVYKQQELRYDCEKVQIQQKNALRFVYRHMIILNIQKHKQYSRLVHVHIKIGA